MNTFALLLAAIFVQAQPPDAFRPQRVLAAQPAIVDPDVLSADEVAHQVEDDELVLGVVLDGVARAYPINMLTGPSREIINDTLAGHAIAATW